MLRAETRRGGAGKGEGGGGGSGQGTSRGTSESRICPARNPAVCAQIGCYLSAAGDRAHSGPCARARAHILPIDTYVRTQARVYTHVHPSTHTHTSTTYKREMRTLPILASKRSPGASFKLPAALSSLSSSLFLSLSLAHSLSSASVCFIPMVILSCT